jgi:hypothetical protein
MSNETYELRNLVGLFLRLVVVLFLASYWVILVWMWVFVGATQAAGATASAAS